MLLFCIFVKLAIYGLQEFIRIVKGTIARRKSPQSYLQMLTLINIIYSTNMSRKLEINKQEVRVIYRFLLQGRNYHKQINMFDTLFTAVQLLPSSFYITSIASDLDAALALI